MMAGETLDDISGEDEAREPEGPHAGREMQYVGAAEASGTTAMSHAAELGTYEYYRDVYPNLDWTPEEA